MDTKTVKYTWAKRGKTYEIYDVPIFSVTKQEGQNITEDTLKQILNCFNIDKAKSYYPRIFIEHHDARSVANKIGAGFLDNLSIKDGILYSDLVEMPESVFLDILQNKRFPYRSVEMLDKKEICGLALLDSKPPFFKFPILLLENDGKDVAESFSLTRRNDKMETEKTEPEKTEPVKKPEETANPMAKIEEMFSKISAALETIAGTLKGHTDKEEGRWKEPPTNAIAYEKDLVKKLGEIEERFATFQLKTKLDTMNFSNEQRASVENYMRKLSTVKDREVFLEAFSSTMPKFQETVTPQPFLDSPNLTKYEKLDPNSKQVAREAYKIYQETVEAYQRNDASRLAMFQKLWPNAETFVDVAVEESKVNPDYLKSLCTGK